MVLSSMQLQKVSVTLWFRRLQCPALHAVLSVFIDLRSAECVCSYYGLRVCSQTNKRKRKITNSPASKLYQAHVLTRTGGIIWKTVGKKILTSLAYLIVDCEWIALSTRFWVVSAGIFSTKYNLNNWKGNSFKLPYILQIAKKSNI